MPPPSPTLVPSHSCLLLKRFPLTTDCRLAAKELAGIFNFTHKAFVKMISRRGGTPADASATNLPGGGHDNGVARGDNVDKEKGKGAKKRRKGEETEVLDAAAAAAAVGESDGQIREGEDDTRHLSVSFLCSFMESGGLLSCAQE